MEEPDNDSQRNCNQLLHEQCSVPLDEAHLVPACLLFELLSKTFVRFIWGLAIFWEFGS